MFDEPLRRGKDRAFAPLAHRLAAAPPWLLSLAGLGLGVGAAGALWGRAYAAAFVLWFLNRAFDGLDGAVARLRDEQSDLGGYLDIVFDFVVYALIPVGVVLGQPSTAATAALVFLLCTYYVNAASWMYLAAILEKCRRSDGERLTTVAMPAGIIGGAETIVFYTAFIFFPGAAAWLFGLMGLLLVVTIVQRLAWARRHLA